MDFTACYMKIKSGYMGRLLEWPEVITEGGTLEECRAALIDAAREMAVVYHEDGLSVPQEQITIEPLHVEGPIREKSRERVPSKP